MVAGSARNAPGVAKPGSDVLCHPRSLICQSESSNSKSGSEIVSIAPENAASIKGRCSRCRRFNARSEEHTSELQSHLNLVCRLLLEKKKKLKLCSTTKALK